MKKLLATILCISLMSINLTCLAETAKPVSVNTEPSTLESKLLRKQYSAYSVTYLNNGQTPLLINNIRGENLIGDMNKINVASKYSKADYVMQGLGFVTLGLTTVINMFVKINNIQKSGAEAVKYANTQLIRAKNEVIMPEQGIKFYVLVPLNQTPLMTAVFEDTTTHEYTSVDTAR